MAKKKSVKKFLRITVDAIYEKKGEDIVILDVREITTFTDYQIICHGTSRRQVQAIAEFAAEKLKKSGCKPFGMEGFINADWVLIDCVGFVVHIFLRQKREFYDLEALWGGAKHVRLSSVKKASARVI